jgi:hypothetical protein
LHVALANAITRVVVQRPDSARARARVARVAPAHRLSCVRHRGRIALRGSHPARRGSCGSRQQSRDTPA